MHGNLKDYLIECKEAVQKLNHTPCVMGYRRSIRLRSSTSSSYALLRGEKIPLSQQSSIFSDISMSSKTNAAEGDAVVGHPPVGGFRAQCLTQDSGLSVSESPGSSDQHLSHEYTNCKGLLYMEDVMNFAFQIACGLQHLEQLGVRFNTVYKKQWFLGSLLLREP